MAYAHSVKYVPGRQIGRIAERRGRHGISFGWPRADPQAPLLKHRIRSDSLRGRAPDCYVAWPLDDPACCRQQLVGPNPAAFDQGIALDLPRVCWQIAEAVDRPGADAFEQSLQRRRAPKSLPGVELRLRATLHNRNFQK